MRGVKKAHNAVEGYDAHHIYMMMEEQSYVLIMFGGGKKTEMAQSQKC